jgi:hypothetical protein
MRHSKLIEALGLALLCLSWALEWSNYKKYDQEIDTFVKTFNSITDTYRASHQDLEMSLQSAVTRDIIRSVNPINSSDSNGNSFVMAWKSKEVRTIWTKSLMTSIDQQENYLRISKDRNDRYALGLEGTINDIRKSLNLLREPLDRGGPLKYNQVYTVPETLPASVALEVDFAVKPVMNKNMKLWNEITQILP